VILRLDRPLLEILQDLLLHPETVLSTESASSEDWWRAVSGPSGLILRIDAPVPR
jgi:hypothetical protein